MMRGIRVRCEGIVVTASTIFIIQPIPSTKISSGRLLTSTQRSSSCFQRSMGIVGRGKQEHMKSVRGQTELANMWARPARGRVGGHVIMDIDKLSRSFVGPDFMLTNGGRTQRCDEQILPPGDVHPSQIQLMRETLKARPGPNPRRYHYKLEGDEGEMMRAWTILEMFMKFRTVAMTPERTVDMSQ